MREKERETAHARKRKRARERFHTQKKELNHCACCFDLTWKRGSVGQSKGLSIPRSSVRFRLKNPDNSNSHEFELHRPSNKGTKLLLKVIKAIIILSRLSHSCVCVCVCVCVNLRMCVGVCERDRERERTRESERERESVCLHAQKRASNHSA